MSVHWDNKTKVCERMKSVIWVALALVFGGCASVEGFTRLMDGQIGRPIAEVQNQFGYNHIERKLDSGGRAFTWVWSESGESPSYQSPTTIRSYGSAESKTVTINPGTYFPPQKYTLACEFTFLVNDGDKVTAWRAHGNGCASFPGPENFLSSDSPRKK
jgi:hypothetical protein